MLVLASFLFCFWPLVPEAENPCVKFIVGLLLFLLVVVHKWIYEAWWMIVVKVVVAYVWFVHGIHVVVRYY